MTNSRRSTDVPALLNRQAAFDYVHAMSDPVLRQLLQDALQAATVRFVRADHMSEEEFAARLPENSFDLLFYLTVVRELIGDPEWCRDIGRLT